MDKIEHISHIAYQLSDTIDGFLSKEKEFNDELTIALEQMSQQAYNMAQDLKYITERFGI
jgi:hypothetical protein